MLIKIFEHADNINKLFHWNCLIDCWLWEISINLLVVYRESQRSKLTFSKSRLLATFNCKMVAIKKFWSPKKNKIIIIIMTVISRDGHLVYVTWFPTTPSDTFATLPFAKLLRLLACRLKYCSNGRDKEKEESSMSGSRNDLLQTCWDRVTNHQWHIKPFKSIKICRDDYVNN